MRRFFIDVFSPALLLAFTTVSASVSVEPKRGGTLSFAISKKMKLMNPLVRSSSKEKSLRRYNLGSSRWVVELQSQAT